MSLLLIFMVFISSLFHVLWNMLGKKGVPSAAFFLGTAATAVLVFLPVYTYLFPFSAVPRSLWKYLLVSGFFQTVYYIGLGRGYRSGELSYVYPLARALPVIMIPLLSLVTGTGIIYSMVNGIGMMLVFTGCFILPFERGRVRTVLKRYFSDVFLFSLLAAAGTTGYTIVDSEGMNRLLALSPHIKTKAFVSIYYLAYEMFFDFISLLIYVIVVKKERKYALEIVKRSKINTIASGIIILLAYGIILVTYTMFESVSYIAAFRQMSIPLGVIAGILILKEKQNFGKIAGSLIIFAGLVLVYV